MREFPPDQNNSTSLDQSFPDKINLILGSAKRPVIQELYTIKGQEDEMRKIKRHSMLTLILSGFSILALIISHLALTDIYHGEEDVSLEWLILRISAVIFLIFIISTIFTLTQVLKINR